MEYGTLLLASLEPCWLWWLILSALAFILGAILGCLLCGNRRKLKELEEENQGLKARNNNWEKDYIGLKYQHEEAQKDLKSLRNKLNSCEADKSILQSKIDKLEASAGGGPEMVAGNPGAASGGIAFASLFPSDNLQIVEGIGPKIEGVLKAAGIKNWAGLAAKSEADLRKILTDANPSFRIHNPGSWPEQARLAQAGKWDDLIAMQQGLDAKGAATDKQTPSKVKKLAMKVLGFSSDPTDLKIIEGIGPKIEALLKADGIRTWQELADATPERLTAILEQGGGNFRLAKPDSWPQQAALASAGNWGALSELQERLQGGVDKG